MLSLTMIRQPGDLGAFVAIERRGGSEDPWLCVADFGQVCLYRKRDSAPPACGVNSGMYLSRAKLKG